MSIIKRKGSSYLWIKFSVKKNGKRVQVRESAKTTVLEDAKAYEIKRKKEVLDELLYGKLPDKTWLDAVEQWKKDRSSKRTLKQDEEKFEWINQHLGNMFLKDINAVVIEQLADKKSTTGVSPATINRMLAVVKSVLNRACKYWEWINKVPRIQMRKEPAERIRWLTRNEADRLIVEVPIHLRPMIRFTLETGLRAKNLCNLKWSDIDFDSKVLWVKGDDFKTGKNLVIPLTQRALDLLDLLKNNGSDYVFLYKGKKISQPNTKAFRKALDKAKIKDFRWHDLRHTWASWHIQKGTPLEVLKQLGGWSSLDMVLKYAHVTQEQLQAAQGTAQKSTQEKSSKLEEVT